MLNKPVILTLLLTAIFIFFELILKVVFTIIGLKSGDIPSLALAMLAALYVGQIYSSTYRIELSKVEKIKICFYFFIIQLLITLSFILLLKVSISVLQMLSVTCVLNVLMSLFIYVALGRGCKMKLKQSENDILLKAQAMVTRHMWKAL